MDTIPQIKTKVSELVLSCSVITHIPPSELWAMDVVEFYHMAAILEKRAQEQTTKK